MGAWWTGRGRGGSSVVCVVARGQKGKGRQQSLRGRRGVLPRRLQPSCGTNVPTTFLALHLAPRTLLLSARPLDSAGGGGGYTPYGQGPPGVGGGAPPPHYGAPPPAGGTA